MEKFHSSISIIGQQRSETSRRLRDGTQAQAFFVFSASITF
jgi:hypothetical protein